jgi:hypothetical protein
MANWHRLIGLSIHGRVMLANAMIYSISRYWLQSSIPPERVIERLEADVYHLLWCKDHEFEVEAIGTNTKDRPYIKNTAVYNKRKWNQDAGLGIGLLDLRNHAKALRVKWALRYLDASDKPWKVLLDKWLARSSFKIANVISQRPADRLVGPMNRRSGNESKLPAFWQTAIEELKELERKRRLISPLGAGAQPLWNNAIEDVRPDQKYIKVWKELRTTKMAHLTDDNYQRYTREGNLKALELEPYQCDTIEPYQSSKERDTSQRKY